MVKHQRHCPNRQSVIHIEPPAAERCDLLADELLQILQAEHAEPTPSESESGSSILSDQAFKLQLADFIELTTQELTSLKQKAEDMEAKLQAASQALRDTQGTVQDIL